MRLVLVQPPIRDFYDTDVRLQPIGLCYLKAAVRCYLPEVEVIIRDYHHGGGRQTVALPDALADLAAFYPVPDRSPFSAFHAFYHFGHAFDASERDYVRARLSALGVESDGVSRQDVYTLFLTTRIFNFLKGLDVAGNGYLAELLGTDWTDARVRVGIEQLRRLSEQGTLDFASRSGWTENRNFRPGLFLAALRQAGHIAGLRGSRIDLDRYAAGLSRSLRSAA